MKVKDLKKFLEGVSDDAEVLINRTIQDVTVYENVAYTGKLPFTPREKTGGEKENSIESFILFPLLERLVDIDARVKYLGKTGCMVSPKVIE